MNKCLLQEDDCAPDAREYFIKDMKKKFKLNFTDFMKNKPKESDNEMTLNYHHNGYTLKYSGDDPFYRLYKD